jgi:Signal transduction histidine kinase
VELTKKLNSSARRNLIYITMFFVLVLAIWIGFLFAPQPDIAELPQASGTYDLSGYDFDDTVYRVNNRSWESWAYQLYTPDDFANSGVEEQSRFFDSAEAMNTSYATHRLRLTLPPGSYYGISMVTAEYAMRIYINGSELDSVGIPGNTRETTEHRTAERTYYFSPQEDGTVEVLVQTANFVHNDGSGAPAIVIGGAGNIMERDNADIAVSFLIVGCLIAAALHHLGLFCLNRQRKIDLIFALCCMFLALMNKKLLLLFWPNYVFAAAIRLEYIIHFLTFASFIYFLEQLHPRLLHRYITRSYYALTGLYLLTLFLDTLIFTRLIVGFQTVSVCMITYVLVRLAMSLKERRLQNYLSFAGIVVLGLMGANDILYYRNIVIVPPVDGQFFMAPIGMIFFVFCYALAMSIEHAETEQAMLEAREKARQLTSTNELKEKLLATISHEARTPLAVLSSYASLVAIELRDKGMDKQTTADLDKISFEAKRVANLIDSMKRMTLSNQKMEERIALDLGDIARQTAQLYMPILERTGVSLIIQSEENLPMIFGNPAELTQVLFNLLQNSKNHTTSGSVTVSVERDGDYVATYITDTGRGVPPDILPDIFERGIKGDDDGGSGIGLAVCKEIIEAHNGTIRIDSELGKGTVVTVVFPVYKEDNENE